MQSGKPILLYDGDCGFCQAAVEWLRCRDASGQIDCLPSFSYPHLTPELHAQAQTEIVYLDGGKNYGGADGALRAYCFLRPYSPLQIFRVPPMIWVARLAYRWIARNRLRVSRWLGIPATCRLPDARD